MCISVPLKVVQSYNRKLFLCFRHKNRRELNKNFKLFFFHNKFTFYHISARKKLKFPLINSVYLVFLHLEMQRRLKQTKVYHTNCYFVWKETTHKPLKEAGVKTFFSSVHVTGTTCFNECFYSMWLEDFHKVYRFSEVFLTAMLMLSLVPMFSKKVVFYALSPQ